MKALTLHQPWATLIASGHKTIETRSWPTKHRGPIAIHAAKTLPSWVLPLNIGGFEVDKDNPGGTAPSYLLRGPIAWPYRLPLGCVVATAELVDCLPIGRCHEPDHEAVPKSCVAVRWPGDQAWLVTPSPSGAGRMVSDITGQLPFGDFEPGRWAWLLDNVQRIQPVPARGKQGLWEWAS